VDDGPEAELRGGERLNDCVAWAAQQPSVEAVLLNCCAPETISDRIPHLAKALSGMRTCHSLEIHCTS
jgi:S-methylmethionine-dependent homocysteine/selenocysteine methylase